MCVVWCYGLLGKSGLVYAHCLIVATACNINPCTSYKYKGDKMDNNVKVVCPKRRQCRYYGMCDHSIAHNYAEKMGCSVTNELCPKCIQANFVQLMLFDIKGQSK